MELNSFDALLYTAVFLVPGFIWSSVMTILIPRRAAATELRLLEFLTLSCINHALWIWLLVPLFRGGWMNSAPIWSGVLLVFPVLVSPIILGALSGWARQRDWMKLLLGRFGFRTVHPVPTAWDFQFARGKPYWVVVTMKDGSRVFGLYGYQSFAGDEPSERDLYLEAVFEPTNTGEWAPVQDSGGIIIKAEQIAAIEFRKHSEVQYDF